MNKTQETTSFKENYHKIGKMIPVSSTILGKNHIEFLDKTLNKNSIERNSLAKSVLFECMKCGGALVPSSKCIRCQKTSIRVCVKCDSTQKSGAHSTCEYMIIWAKTRKNIGNVSKKFYRSSQIEEF